MQRVETKTAPRTAPTYRPPIYATCGVVDEIAEMSLWPYVMYSAGSQIKLNSAEASCGWPMRRLETRPYQEVIVVDVASAPTTQLSLRDNAAIALDLAPVWRQLMDGFFAAQMFPATTIQSPTTRQVITGTAAALSLPIELSSDGCREIVGQRDRPPILARLENLSDNWDSHGAKPPDERALSNAETVLRLARRAGLAPRMVSPSAEGGVAIIFRTATRYADIECLNTSEILATISDGSGRPVVWEITVAEVSQALSLIRAYLA